LSFHITIPATTHILLPINYHYIVASFHQYLNQKRTRRGRAIDHLVKTNDQRIQNISRQDLLLLKNEIPYHSPEESMTDTSDEEGNKGPAHLVAVMNLQWRSNKVSKLRFILLISMSLANL